MDQWQLNRNQLKRQNLIGIDVAGYTVNSYYTLDHTLDIQNTSGKQLIRE